MSFQQAWYQSFLTMVFNVARGLTLPRLAWGGGYCFAIRGQQLVSSQPVPSISHSKFS